MLRVVARVEFEGLTGDPALELAREIPTSPTRMPGRVGKYAVPVEFDPNPRFGRGARVVFRILTSMPEQHESVLAAYRHTNVVVLEELGRFVENCTGVEITIGAP